MATVGCSDGDDAPLTQPAPATTTDPENELPVATTPLERDILAITTEAGVPGMQTAVVEDGALIWDRAYGYAVLTPLERAPMTSDSILAISAVSGDRDPQNARGRHADARRVSLTDEARCSKIAAVDDPPSNVGATLAAAHGSGHKCIVHEQSALAFCRTTFAHPRLVPFS